MRTIHRLIPITALTLASVLTACGSSSGGSDGSSGDGSKATTTAAAAADSSSSETTEATDSGDSGDSASGENPGTETLVDGPADAAHTVTLTADGTWDPASLEVAPGEVFTFVAAEGAPTAAVTFNGNDSYTITTGLTESFTLDEPGTYTVKEYLAGAEMTVTVTG